MNIERFKNAKQAKLGNELEKLEKIKQAQVKYQQHLDKLKTELKNEIIKVINSIIKVPEKLMDEYLDDLLTKNIFENSNDENSYIIPIKISIPGLYFTIIEEFTNGGNNTIDYETKFKLHTAPTINIKIFNTSSIFNIFEFSDISHYFYNSYYEDEEIEKPGKFRAIYTADNGLDLSEYTLIRQTGFVFNDDRFHEPDIYNEKLFVYNIFNEANINSLTETIKQRLVDYGLNIINIETNIVDLTSDEFIFDIEYNIKFKNPLL